MSIVTRKIHIAENIKNYRAESGMTQKELGELLHVSAQTVCKWENNVCYPDITFLPILAEIIGCTIDDLFN